MDGTDRNPSAHAQEHWRGTEFANLRWRAARSSDDARSAWMGRRRKERGVCLRESPVSFCTTVAEIQLTQDFSHLTQNCGRLLLSRRRGRRRVLVLGTQGVRAPCGKRRNQFFNCGRATRATTCHKRPSTAASSSKPVVP